MPCELLKYLIANKNTYYIINIYIYIKFLNFFTLSVSCLFFPVAIVMDLTTKHIKNHNSKLVLAILYIHMHNIVGTDLFIYIYIYIYIHTHTHTHTHIYIYIYIYIYIFITLFQSNTTILYHYVTVLGQHVSTLIESSSGPSRIRSEIK